MAVNNPGPGGATGNAFGTTSWPGPAGPSVTLEAGTTQKEKVEIWFIDPLKRMEGHVGFVCLMICFPLIETIMRFELGISGDQDVPFSGNSQALHWFASFMRIPEAQARDTWDAFRNGLLHRAMIKSSVQYTLQGVRRGRPAEFKSGVMSIYVWDLRDAVVNKLKEHHSKLWRDPANALAKIHVAI